MRAMLRFAPLLEDPEACDFMAGNPEVPALPGYVETIQKCIEPQHRRWFAYDMPDRRATRAAVESLSEESRRCNPSILMKATTSTEAA